MDVPFLRNDERLEDLRLGKMKIIQPRNGYRFSIDAVVLAHFAPLQHVEQVVDLGTGNGVLPLILAYRQASLKITGLDIQKPMLERARRSVAYNCLEQTIRLEYGDVKTIEKSLLPASADLIVCNPPFWREGEGKLNDNMEVCGARHEIWARLEDFIKAAAYVLKPKGILAMIQRADRLPEILASMEKMNLPVQKIRLIHSHLEREAKMVLLQAGKAKSGTGFTVMAPLIIYLASGSYSEEILSYYGE